MRFLFGFLVNLSLVTFVFGQSTQPGDCPQLGVRGSGIPKPGEQGFFNLDIKPFQVNLPIEIIWRVEGAEIVAGQGTKALTVLYSDTRTLIVQVEVKGLPAGCVATATETSEGLPNPQPKLVAEFGKFTRAMKNTLVAQIDGDLDPTSEDQIYVIIQSLATSDPARQQETTKAIFNTLSRFIDNDPARMTVVTVTGKTELIQVWIVPPGAENPAIPK